MYLEELLALALEIRKQHTTISPTLLMRKLKIKHVHAKKICNKIWQHEAVMRFKERRDPLIHID